MHSHTWHCKSSSDKVFTCSSNTRVRASSFELIFRPARRQKKKGCSDEILKEKSQELAAVDQNKHGTAQLFKQHVIRLLCIGLTKLLGKDFSWLKPYRQGLWIYLCDVSILGFQVSTASWGRNKQASRGLISSYLFRSLANQADINPAAAPGRPTLRLLS